MRAEPTAVQRGSPPELARARAKARERSSLAGSKSSPKASLTFDVSEEDNGATSFLYRRPVQVSELRNKLSDALRVN